MKSFFKEINNSMDHLPSQKNFHVPKIVHIIYWLEYEVFLFFSFFFFCFFLNESVNFESERHIKWFTLCFCKKQGPKDSTCSSLCERAKDEGLFWKPIDLHIPVVSGKGLALKTYFYKNWSKIIFKSINSVVKSKFI